MTSQDGTDSAVRLWRLITGSWVTQAIYVAAELRLPDLLSKGPQTSQALAGATGSDEPSLRRFLRALTTIELCRELEDGSFELRELGSYLTSDSPQSLRSWAIYVGGYQWPIWGHLLDSVKTGKSARELLTGHKMFEHLEQDPSVAKIFNEGMVELTRLIANGVVNHYDFSSTRRIMDVGGGYGAMLAAVLGANPGVQGVLFDLNHAREASEERMASLGLDERIEYVTGSFFESIPAGCDTYLMKNIIHDWNDERSTLILENCRRAISNDGKLLLIERMIPDHLGTSIEQQSIARSDLNMLIGPGGKERTETEFRTLLSSAGFHLNRIIPVGISYNILEAVPS